VQRFLFVTLPALMPGILTGAIMIFIFGITDFLVSLILVTTSNQTLPVLLFGSLRGGVSPLLAAAGGVYIVISFIVVLAITRLRTLDEFLHRST
jgi:putative spermidine/putrescine transport system permease protein